MKGTVLVTDGDERAALAVVRSLGRAGWRTVVLAGRARSLAGSSVHAAHELVVPDPLRDPEAFARAVEGAARQHDAAFVLPIGEAALLAILARRSAFPEGAIPWPSLDVTRAVCDKAHVLAEASRLGIRVPRQVVLSGPPVGPAVRGLPLPVVAKPARSVAGGDGDQRKFRAVHVAAWDQLDTAVARWPASAFPVLVQERIVGPGIGVFLLRWDGTIRAVFAHRRLREKPPAGGVSVYCESVPADPALVDRSAALLERLEWQGVAMVEYKVDAATGEPVLMEINGRFWGSLQLAIDAGVDFPVRLLEAAQGHASAPGPWEVGARLRWWWGDVDHLIARLRHSAAHLGMPPGSPSRWEALRNFCRRAPGERTETWRADDRRPFYRETRSWFRGGA